MIVHQAPRMNMHKSISILIPAIPQMWVRYHFLIVEFV